MFPSPENLTTPRKTKNFYYFLEEDDNIKEDIQNEDYLKKQSCLNLGNSERINSKCEVFKWTNSHNEGLQISLGSLLSFRSF